MSPCFAVAMPMAVRTLGVGVAVGAMLVQVRRCGWPSVGRAEWYAESQAEASRPTAATQCACLCALLVHAFPALHFVALHS